MPRYDNSDPDTLRHMSLLVRDMPFAVALRQAAKDIKNGKDVSGTVAPIDLCADCACVWLHDEIEHPPYEDQLGPDEPYTCCMCDRKLTEEDN